jgi:hypothetical protein
MYMLIIESEGGREREREMEGERRSQDRQRDRERKEDGDSDARLTPTAFMRVCRGEVSRQVLLQDENVLWIEGNEGVDPISPALREHHDQARRVHRRQLLDQR